jgi:hypothetical protein
MLMTSLISFPRIDQAELERTIAIHRDKAATGSVDIKTRSQAMLADAVEKEAWLANELRQINADRQQLEANVASLNDIVTQMKATANDIEVERSAVNQIITMLKAAGVDQ